MNHRSKFLDGLKTYVVRILQKETDSVNDGSDPHKVKEVLGG